MSADSPQVASEAPTAISLFAVFFKVGVLGFGGVAPLARHVLVDQRRWLEEREFAEAFGLASTLPGANTVNLAVMLGDRWCGFVGSLAALTGLLGAPLAILAGAATLYARFGGNPDVRAALSGAAAAAAGLVGGTALRLLRGLDPDLIAILVAGAVCLASAFARLPMLAILAGAVPLTLAAAFLRRRRERTRRAA